DHCKKEWAKGDIHVNGCENRNGFLRAYLRKYRGVSKNHLQGYLDFLSLILNERGKWFVLILSDSLGR
ncbi:MAG: IS1595 family transposase, partial [Nitrososphaerales archaeon]